MFSGKYAIVTGASRGIGFAIAKMLVENGCKVLITGRNEKTLKESAEKLGNNVIPFVWDAEDLTNIPAKFKEAVSLLGKVDIFVNNAGVFAQRNEWSGGSLLKTTVEEWEKVINVNLTGVFTSMQQAVKYMVENNIQGNVLNISSVAAFEPANGAYGASKTAIMNLTKGWGMNFAPHHITINGIAPGPIATMMNNWKEGDPMENSRIPYGRFGTIEEIAKCAKYLLSEDAKMICGETLVFDGAYSIRFN